MTTPIDIVWVGSQVYAQWAAKCMHSDWSQLPQGRNLFGTLCYQQVAIPWEVGEFSNLCNSCTRLFAHQNSAPKFPSPPPPPPSPTTTHLRILPQGRALPRNASRALQCRCVLKTDIPSQGSHMVPYYGPLPLQGVLQQDPLGCLGHVLLVYKGSRAY